MINNYSFTLVKTEPYSLVFNIPFKSSRRVAETTFQKLAFCLNSSYFDKLYWIEHNYKGTRSYIVSFVFFNGQRFFNEK